MVVVGGTVHGMRDAIHLAINGIEPAPQGSKRHVGGGRMVESSKRVAPWREAIRQEAVASGIALVTDAVSVSVVFRFLRPAGHYKKDGSLKPNAPVHLTTRRGDLDKLLRSTLDGLTGALLADDALVVSITASKRYAVGSELPGAALTIIPLGADR
jgi:crossover junction endodeoxyribonuclease RusA